MIRTDSNEPATTLVAVRPVLPAQNFELCKKFYAHLGFDLRQLTEALVEMRLGELRFLLQNHYVKEWADNCVIQLLVSDIGVWWKHIALLELQAQYDVKVLPPRQEEWGLVAGFTDPSGVLWRIIATT